METDGSLPHSQVPSTCHCPEPDQSTPPSHFLKIHINIISHLLLGLPSHLFPPGFPTKTLYAPLPCPIRATYTAYPILHDLINRMIFREEYRSLSSSLIMQFYPFPCTSSLLGPNILYLYIINSDYLQFFIYAFLLTCSPF